MFYIIIIIISSCYQNTCWFLATYLARTSSNYSDGYKSQRRGKGIRTFIYLCVIGLLPHCLQVKCVQYWPNAVGESLTFGPLRVLLSEEFEFADYVVRTIELKVSSFICLNTITICLCMYIECWARKPSPCDNPVPLHIMAWPWGTRICYCYAGIP